MSGKKKKIIETKTEKKNKLLQIKMKQIFHIDDIDVNKILVSKKEWYGKYNSLKYITGYNDNDIIRPLCLKLLKMTGDIEKFDKDTTMGL